MKSAPLVSSPQYETLKVLINLTSDNLEGSGNPVFYQVQYKVSILHTTGCEINYTNFVRLIIFIIIIICHYNLQYFLLTKLEYKAMP